MKGESIQEDFQLNIPEEVKRRLNDQMIAFPGFINAHDHLDFNLFPTFTNRFFEDYTEWGEYLHLNFQDEIQRVLQIPIELRIQFGVLKNLVNGFAGVVHHGNHHERIKSLTKFPVGLNYRYIHSIKTDKFWRIKLNSPSQHPVMIHLGEGKSQEAKEEIDRLLKWNFVRKNVIAVHALSLNENQAKKLEGVVWCPDSNLNLYNETLDVSKVFDNTKVFFGTDSTLSAGANSWAHLRRALELNLVSPETLLKILVDSSYFSSQHHNSFVVARKRSEQFLTSFFLIEPEDIMLVWVEGQPWLCDDSLDLKPKAGVPIAVGSAVKWVHRDLAATVSELNKMKVELPLEIKPV